MTDEPRTNRDPRCPHGTTNWAECPACMKAAVDLTAAVVAYRRVGHSDKMAGAVVAQAAAAILKASYTTKEEWLKIAEEIWPTLPEAGDELPETPYRRIEMIPPHLAVPPLKGEEDYEFYEPYRPPPTGIKDFPMGFESTEIAPGASAVLESLSGLFPVKGKRLIVPSSIGAAFEIRSLMANGAEQFKHPGSVPCRVFAETAVGIMLDLAHLRAKGNTYNLLVKNVSEKPEVFRAMIIAEYFNLEDAEEALARAKKREEEARTKMEHTLQDLEKVRAVFGDLDD